MKNLYSLIATLGRHYGAERIVLFGSRARGDHRERSDVDLAVFGMPDAQQSNFLSRIEELPTLLEFDVVFVADHISIELLDNIRKDGINLMSKAQERLGKFQRAIVRLEEVLADYERYQIESLKDAVIQRFSFCSELAWKTTRDFLLDQGYVDIDTPKATMRKAFSAKLVSNEQDWLDLLKSRNLAAHVYNEETAQKIFDEVQNCYLPLMKELIAAMENME